MNGLTQTLTYRGKTDTVEDMARTLIVASAVGCGGVVSLQLTRERARLLGRYLESSLQLEAQFKAHMAAAEAQVAASKALEDRAIKAMQRAIKINRRAALWSVAQMVVLTGTCVFWVVT